MEQNQSDINHLLDYNAENCMFEYLYEYGCDMTKAEIADLINEYLEIARVD